MARFALMDRLERVVAEWATTTARRLARRTKLDLLQREDERSPARVEALEALETLYYIPAEQRLDWLDTRGWHEEGVLLGCLLLDEAELLPPADRIELPRLAARVSALADIRHAPALATILDDTLGRAGLMEVRALRRRGQLAQARAMFAELEAGFDLEESPRAHLLTLCADRALTAGLLALDEYRTAAAEKQFRRCSLYLRVAGSEEDEAELLFGQARLDLVRGEVAEAVDRLTRAAPFDSPSLRLQTLELVVRAALRAKRPLLVRPPLAALTREAVHSADDGTKDLVTVFEAAVRVLEGRPAEALELIAGPQRRFRAEGRLLPSLTAAVVAARVELALRRAGQACNALKTGVLDQFMEVPATPAIRETLVEISAVLAAGAPAATFLDRVDLWLLLVAESPGVGMAPQA